MPVMFINTKGLTRLRKYFGQFWTDQSGNMSYLAISGALIMMVFGGIGVDLIRAELNRTRIQNTLDRAVLAAADLDNNRDAQATVRDYFRAMDMEGTLSSVDVDQGLNYKDVSGQAQAQMPSLFVHLLGVDTMSASASARAQERMGKVEISMVLDISGSMRRGQRMPRLRQAASTFVDTVLTPETRDLVSINLIPYSEQVNAGPLISQRLNLRKSHDYSYCYEFNSADYNSVPLKIPNRASDGSVSQSAGTAYTQVQHAQTSSGGLREVHKTICPQYSYEQIRAFSQDAQALKNQINQLQPRTQTAIYAGMKWAAALLDPSAQPIVQHLHQSNAVDASFANRPAAYDETDTMKTVVLMTDGRNSNSYRIKNQYYDSPDEVQRWATYNMSAWARTRGGFWRYGTRIRRPSDGDRLLNSICTAAKQRGIIIWSIGFEVDNHGASVMRNCASSPSHFFRVEGVAIQDAFYAIARSITQLRLTQ
jgi:Flp pilus assembly protein TadG